MAIERDAALTDWDLGQSLAHLAIEPIAIHTKVGGRVPITDQTRRDHLCLR
jgi:hypothetical protein